jgi:hypothetical protein
MHIKLDTDDLSIIFELIQRELKGDRGLLIVLKPDKKWFSLRLDTLAEEPNEAQLKNLLFPIQSTGLPSEKRTP